jgi:cytochrome b subunit of formate dehydrogenase
MTNKKLSCLIVFLACLIFFSTNVWAQKNDICYNCHDIKDSFINSVHGKHNVLCISCHEDPDFKRPDLLENPHKAKEQLKKVLCSQCHRVETQIYLESDHGKSLSDKGKMEAASCKDCHGSSHAILNFEDPLSPVNKKNIVTTCAKCHEDNQKMSQYKLSQFEPVKSYKRSVHGVAMLEHNDQFAATCTDCHGSHNLHSHSNPDSKIYKFNVPKTCGKCHENVYQTFSRSIHGVAIEQGMNDAPVCTDCHDEHLILKRDDPSSTTYTLNVSKETCSVCHQSERTMRKYGIPVDMVGSYNKSYHGLAVEAGSLVSANCSSCHGFHDILPSTDKRSSIYPDNLNKTCGKCHPGAGKGAALGSVHVRPSRIQDKAVYYVTIFYIFIIVLTIGGMLLHNFADFWHKLVAHYRKSREGGHLAQRMSISERIQHIILLICFLALVYTGFAHHYPNAWWATPFSFSSAGNEIRGFLHRFFALIFVGLSVYHAVWMVLTKRGKGITKDIFPAKKDLTDFLSMAKYYVGKVKIRPRFARFNYIEKAEYWALVWGSAVMIATGFFLTFENMALSLLPKWLLDVFLTIHFYEAILASLAILVWHFYWTIFNPEIYPMNWSWITDKTNQEEERDE